MGKGFFRNLGLTVTLGFLVLGPASVLAQSVITGGDPPPPLDPWNPPTGNAVVLMLSLATN